MEEAVNPHGRAGRLAERTALLERRLAGLSRHAWLAASRLSGQTVAGDFRTRRSVARGVERDVPRVFTLEDDPGALDLGRLGPAFALNPLWSILNGELRVTRSVLTSESECVVILDLSRSVFSGCLGVRWGDGPDGPEWAKLTALYNAAAAFLGAAAAARFTLRIAYLHGGGLTEDRPRARQGGVAGALAMMSRFLLATFRTAEGRPGSGERFALGDALRVPRRLKVRGDVVVISDFLDPLTPDPEDPEAPGYLEPLAGLIARHNVRLVDIARPGSDLNIRLPHWLRGVNRAQRYRLQGARHLEKPLAWRWNTRPVVHAWNAARDRDRRRLDDLLARWNVRRDETFVADPDGRRFRPLDALQCQSLALSWLRACL